MRNLQANKSRLLALLIAAIIITGFSLSMTFIRERSKPYQALTTLSALQLEGKDARELGAELIREGFRELQNAQKLLGIKDATVYAIQLRPWPLAYEQTFYIKIEVDEFSRRTQVFGWMSQPDSL